MFEQTPFIEHFNLARTECTGKIDVCLYTLLVNPHAVLMVSLWN